MRIPQILPAIALACFFTATAARAMVYMIDPDHSSVSLGATHLGVGTVQGRFDKFSGTFEFDPKKIGASKVQVRIDASSINTNQSFRDEHLRSAEFLDTRKYPEIAYESVKVTAGKQNELRIEGNLTLHGITRPVLLLATLGGVTKDMEGKNRIGFSTSTQINRRDYGILWDQRVGGSILVGQVVQIFLNIEGVEQTEAPAK